MKLFSILIFLLSFFNSFSQTIVVNQYGDTTIYHNRHLIIGREHDGIGFGNFIYYNGIKFAILDKDTLTNGISVSISQRHQPKKTNGVELAANLTTSEVNGLALGILNSVYIRLNGINVAAVYDYTWRSNGITIAGLFQMNDISHGISFGGLADIQYIARGFSMACAYDYIDSSLIGIGVSGIEINTGSFKGITIAPINITSKGKGVQVGIINEAKKLKGLQVGLLNINKSKKHLKVLPLINFN